MLEIRPNIIEQNILGVNVEISKDNIKILNSYKITNKEKMITILKIIRNIALKKGYLFKRTNKSWLKEWKAHNLLYRLNIFREHTIDTDLEEHESKFRLICYEFLGL